MDSSPPSVSTSRIFAVPQLDEDSLKTLPTLGTANAAAAGKTGAGGSNGGFTLVVDGMPNYGGGGGNGGAPGAKGSNAPSPTHGADANELAYLQQQQAAAVAAATAQLEQDYLYTQVLLQQSPRPILHAVLTSLMEDFPTTLISPIKARLEHFINANSALKGNMMAMNGLVVAGTPAATPMSGTPSPTSAMSRNGRRASAAAFVPNSGAAPWTPSSQQQQHQQQHQGGMSSATTPYSHTHSPSHSRGGNSTSKGKGKGGKEEQEMCSIHHSMRAMKHLHINENTGLYECAHGFHCLVDEPAAPKKETGGSTVVSPERKPVNGSSSSNVLDNKAMTSSSAGFTVVGGDSTNDNSVLEGSDGCIGGRGKSDGNSQRGGSGNRFIDPVAVSGYPAVLQNGRPNSGSMLGRGSGARPDGASPSDDELLVYTMKLLQSVRDIDDEEA